MTAYHNFLLSYKQKSLHGCYRRMMKVSIWVLLFCNGLLNLSATAPPNWTVNPADYQFRMDMVIRINFDGNPSNDPGNLVGVFVGPQLRGVASATQIGSDMYFFTTIYSNTYTGETLNFRIYHAPNDQVYPSEQTVLFTNYAIIGKIDQPFWLNIDPDLDFPPEILHIPADTTLQTIPFDTVDLVNHLLSSDGDPVTWSLLPGSNLLATLDQDRLIVSPLLPNWTGTDSVRIVVTENTANQLSDTTHALFTVMPDYGPPVWGTIPGQSIFGGSQFSDFDLDDYLTFNGPCRAFDFVLPSPYTPMTTPVLPILNSNGNVHLQIKDTLWRGSIEMTFFVWDCNFPTYRRDTTTVVFTISDDENPFITSAVTVNFQELACSLLYDTETVDPNDAEGSGLTYTLTGGADVSKFAIDAVNGKLTWFNFTPDFDIPGDANADNQYEVTIQVTNLLNLSDEIDLVVTVIADVNGPFDPQLSGNNGTCIANGAAVLSASGGVGYLWNTNETTPAISVSNSGTYSVIITDETGCADTLSTTMQVAPTLMATGNVGIVCSGTPINLTSNPSGGSGVYVSFSWTGPNNFTSNIQNPVAFPASVAASGTYFVTVTDNAGCFGTSSVNIMVSNNPAPLITALNNGPLCVGQDLALSSNPSGGSGTYTSYKWSGPNNFSANLRNPLPFASLLAYAGTFSVTVTDNQGCIASGSTTVVVNPNPSIIATGNGPLCAGSTVILGSSASGGSGVFSSFSWSGPNMYTNNVENPPAFPGTTDASGTYAVMVTDNKGCSASAMTTITITSNPTLSAMVVGPTCLGGNITLASSPSGGTAPYATFTWTGPNGFASNAQNPLSFPATPAATGTYHVTVTDQANCSATATTSLTVNPVPSITAGSNTPVCQGTNLLLTSTPSGGSGVFSTFKWTGPDNFVASAANPAGFTTSLASGGTYHVTVTDSNGCTSSDSTNVVIVPKPSAVASGNGIACTGTLIHLSVTPSGGSGTFTGFNWIGPNGFMSTDQEPTEFPAIILSAGTYFVTVTDDAGCQATSSTSLSVSTNVAPTINAFGNGPLCPGGTILLTSTISGGNPPYSNINWVGPNGFTSDQQNPTGFPATVAASGKYMVKVQDSKSCDNTSSVEVIVSPPTIQAFNEGNCVDPDIVLTSIPSGGTGVYISFSWEGPNGFLSNLQNPPPIPRTPAAQGTYSVTVTDSQGCTGVGTTIVDVGDTIAPIIIPGMIESCYSTLAEAQAAALAATSATDNCPGALTETVSTIGTCMAMITVTVTDEGMNSSSTTYQTRIDNTPPNVSAGTISDCYVTVADAEEAAIDATIANDNCPGTLLYSAMTTGSPNATIVVTVTDFCGNFASVNYNTIIFGAPPAVPTNITAVVLTSTSVFINWNDAANADRYQVRYRVQGTTAWTNTGNVFISEITINGLTPNNVYQFQVRSRCGNSNNSAWSTTLTFFTSTCLTPTGVMVFNITQNSATVSWPAVPGALSYLIRYRRPGFNWTTSSSSTTTRILSGLLPNTLYEVQVASFCSGGAGAWSASVNFTTVSNKSAGPFIARYPLKADIVDWRVYPNPAVINQQLSIEVYSGKVVSYEVSLMDTHGRILHFQTGIFETGFNLIDLQSHKLISGMYFVRLSLADSTLSKRVLIMQ